MCKPICCHRTHPPPSGPLQNLETPLLISDIDVHPPLEPPGALVGTLDACRFDPCGVPNAARTPDFSMGASEGRVTADSAVQVELGYAIGSPRGGRPSAA